MKYDDRPNIVLIITDQMRGDCLSILGHPVVKTPNLDELGYRGAVFTRAYSTCPSCIAARASLMTGLSPSAHGRLGYQDRVPWRYERMLPQALSDAGYQTHCVGKTHFFPQGAHFGFHSLDTYEGAQNFDGTFVNDYYEWLREQSNGRYVDETASGLTFNSWNARPSPLPEEWHNNSWVATKSIDFLRRRDPTRPFFLNVSFHRPHPPIDPPQVFFDLYQDVEIPPPPVGDWAAVHDVPVTSLDAWHGRLDPLLLAQARRGYYAQIAHIDCQIGRILRKLDQMKLDRPTVFLFTSDHGEMLGDHHLFRKTYAYEGSARVPFLLTLPEAPSASRYDIPVILEDVYATLLDIAGVEIPDGIAGRSLLPVYRSKVPRDWRTYLHGEHAACYSEDQAMQFLTDGKEKYIWFTKDGTEQFFDLDADPWELHNLAKDPSAADRVAKWRTRLVEELSKRPQDKLTDGKRLCPGTLLPRVRPELLEGAA